MNDMRKLMETVKPLYEAMTYELVAKDLARQGVSTRTHSEKEIMSMMYKFLTDELAMSPTAARSTMNGDFPADVFDALRQFSNQEDHVQEAYDHAEEKEAALEELVAIMEQLSELGEHASDIMANYFPSHYDSALAYGALNFGSSQNPYDVTFEKIVNEIAEEDFNNDDAEE